MKVLLRVFCILIPNLCKIFRLDDLAWWSGFPLTQSHTAFSVGRSNVFRGCYAECQFKSPIALLFFSIL